MARIVAVTAHPDDETIFAGGTLAKLASEGNEVIIVATTRGEGGEVGEPPLSDKKDLGAWREQELRCAAAALGAAGVVFLGFLDPSIEVGEQGRAIDTPFDEFRAGIEACLLEWQPDVVITHGSGGEYGHPQHVWTHRAVLGAVTDLRPSHPIELLTWMANPGNRRDERLINKDDPADVVVDVTPWLDAKAAALDCHRTQHAMIRRNSKRDNVREILSHVENFRRWFPGAWNVL